VVNSVHAVQADFWQSLLPPPRDVIKIARSGTFTDNMKLPVHRWFRYSAGFSAQWVADTIRARGYKDKRRNNILDPFCGSGTTLIEAAKSGADATGFEPHPFIFKIARCKTERPVDAAQLYLAAEEVLHIAERIKKDRPNHPSCLIQKCYAPENLARLESLRDAYFEKSSQVMSEGTKNLLWLAITCILRECSGVGTAQWQYLLPNRQKAKVSDPWAAFKNRISMFCRDMREMQDFPCGRMQVIETDARNPACAGAFNLVITSPPYPNNYDYADATRLEMMFWQDIESWGGLHDAVRQYLMRSCSQHAAKERLRLDDLLQDVAIDSIKAELEAVCTRLDHVRHDRGGKKTYHTMVAAYFADMARVFLSLRRLTTQDAAMAFVIGDSAPYGVYVPVEKWLGTLAVAAGFEKFRFEKIRDRNIKWKNRKHTVPLKEGILWIEA